MKSIMLCYNLKGTKKKKDRHAGKFSWFSCEICGKRRVFKDNRSTDRTERRSGGRGIKEETSGTDKEKNEEITDFEEEMLVMLLADNRILDKLLFQMKKEKVQVPLKQSLLQRIRTGHQRLFIAK